MRIWIEGDAERDQFLKKQCAEKGMILSSASDCDIAVLRFPYSTVTEEMAGVFPESRKIVCGITDEKTYRFAKEKNWILYEPLQDEQYLCENAVFTAEGAICAAMKKITISLKDTRCLIIGYGRIGKELMKMLRSFGADVIVAARREESRLEAGENSIQLNRIRSVISKMDLIFNTIPSPIILESSLLLIKNTAFLFELASKPYGFDMEKARELGVHAYLESGIPGRYCPQSSAAALLRYIERSVQIE